MSSNPTPARKRYKPRQIPTPADEQSIIAAYLMGMSAREAGRYAGGFGHTTVLSVLKRNGVPRRSVHLSPDQEAAMIAAYEDGASAIKAANIVGATGGACIKALARRSIRQRQYRLTATEEDAIIAAYLTGMSAGEAAASVGHWSASTALGVLHRRGIPRRGLSECHRIYTANHSYFAQIDSEDQAYWLGFWAADGWVYRGAVGVSLNVQDEDHLRKLRDALGSDHPITHYDTRRKRKRDGSPIIQARFSFRSPEMIRDLASLGVTERKSFTIQPPRLPPDLERHFWRGMVDGDGSIARFRKQPIWDVSLTSASRAMIEAFAAFVEKRAGYRARIHLNRRTFQVKLGGVELPQRVARILYDDAAIYLDRKMDRAKALLSVPVRNPRLIGRVLEFRGEKMRAFEWADRLGIPRMTLINRLHGGMSVERALTKPVTSTKVALTLNGETHSIAEWSRRTGINRTTIEARLRAGWTHEKALTTAVSM